MVGVEEAVDIELSMGVSVDVDGVLSAMSRSAFPKLTGEWPLELHTVTRLCTHRATFIHIRFPPL